LRAALITGGGSGIGAAICKALAQSGVNIAVNHLGEADRAGAEAVASDCRAAGVEAVVVQGDVGKDEDCCRLVQVAASQWERLDFLVNNAGYSRGHPLSDLDGQTVEEFELAYRVNSIGPFLLTRYAAPHMRASGGGAVVNVSSMAGLTGVGSSYGYVGSKAALINLTRTLARVLAPEIRVNVVCPGLVDTPWPRRALGDRFGEIAKLAERAPMGSVLKPEEVAVPVAFLLLDAVQITGEVLRIVGGGHLGSR